jgi:SAM-dependent methyltransferase
MSQTAFDEYAKNYDEALEQGIAVSGEDKNYFAKGRIAWLAGCLKELGESPAQVMDYGCGTGTATPFFFELIGARSVIGAEISTKAIEIATQTYASECTQFFLFDDYLPDEKMDLVFCNGVFHHIPPAQRASAVNYIYRSIKPGGLFAFWENNPWNPGTRYVMSRIPFDRDAITLTPPEARGLLTDGGFEVLRTDFQFIFPRSLGWFRTLEPYLSRDCLSGKPRVRELSASPVQSDKQNQQAFERQKDAAAFVGRSGG